MAGCGENGASVLFRYGQAPGQTILYALDPFIALTWAAAATGRLRLLTNITVVAYRNPFLLAKIDPNSATLSLCFDPTSDLIGETDGGAALFNGEKQPTDHTKGLLQFCEKFEEAGNKTQLFVEELKKADLLMDGEVAINRNDEQDKPFVYRGFQMINQEKLAALPGDQLRKWSENGMLPLIYAQLFSIDLMRVVFAKQVEQGKVPERPVMPAPTN